MAHKEVIDVPELGDSKQRSYNQCIRTGDMVSVAGQTGVNKQYEPVSSDFEEQAEQAFQNVEYALKAAGGGLEDMVHMTVFLTDMRHAENFVELRGDILGDDLATSSLIGVNQLASPSLKVEIESRAYIPEN
jgi:enamine deaminase RidA (YjgF/YER057c/UK114 family)